MSSSRAVDIILVAISPLLSSQLRAFDEHRFAYLLATKSRFIGLMDDRDIFFLGFLK